MAYIGQAPSTIVSENTFDEFNFTATSNQTTFTGVDSDGKTLVYNPGNLEVFLNGVRLEEADFTATNGTSVVLATGATTGDVMSVKSFTVFEVSDTVSKASGGAFGGNISVTGTVTATSYSGDGSSLSGISTDVVGDITPQLGGNLDLNSKNISGTGNIDVTGSVTASTTVNVGTGGGFYLKQDNSESTIRSESQPIILQTYSSAWQDRLTIKNDGNVGIGTTTPGSRRLKIEGSSSAYPLSLDSTNTDYAMEFQRNGASEWWLKASSTSFQIHENGVGDKLTVLAGGNVGIGTNNPTKLLHLYGDENSGGLGLVIQDDGWGAPNGMFMTTVRNSDGAYTIRKNTSNAFDFATYTDMLSVRGDGNVGIGTTTPASKLHIQETASAGTGILLTNNNNQAGTYSDIKWQYSSADSSYASGLRFKQVDTTHGGQIEFYTDNNSGTFTKQMEITENGHVTMPNQPSCSIYNCGFGSSATSWSSAGSGSENGGLVGVAHHNNGNHYNTSTGYFTAPVAGYYLCNLNVYGKKDNNHGDNAGYWWGYFQKNGGYYAGNYIMEAYYNSGDYDQGASISSIIYLAVNDTVRPYCGSYIHGIQVYGPNTSFSCHLLG